MWKKINDYTYNTSDMIGSGTTSIVYLGHSILTNDIVAIRVISLSKLVPETRQNLQNQMSVLNYLPYHPNIVKLHCLIQTQNHVYVVTEYCDTKLQIFDSYDVGAIASGIIEGIKHLITNNVMHRDLKPENVMLKNGIPKIIDFGFARRFSNLNEVMYEFMGTPFYMAPQMLQQRYYTPKADVWSLGVLLYQILYKVLPFQAETGDQLIKVIRSTAPYFPGGCNDMLTLLIQGCLIVDEVQRYSWEEVFIIASQLQKSSMKENIKQPSLTARDKSPIKMAQRTPKIPLQNVFVGYIN